MIFSNISNKQETTFIENTTKQWVLGTLIGIFLICIAGWIYFWQTFQYNIIPAVTIQEVPVGTLTFDEAKHTLEATLPPPSFNFTIKVESENKDISLLLHSNDIQVSYDFDSALREAYAIGRDESWTKRAKSLFSILFIPTNIPLSLTYNSTQMESILYSLKSEIDIEAIPPSFSFNPLSLSTGTQGVALDIEKANNLIDNHIKNTPLNPDLSLEDAVVTTGVELTQEEKERLLALAKPILDTSFAFDLANTDENESLYQYFFSKRFLLSDVQYYPASTTTNPFPARLEWKSNSKDIVSLIELSNKDAINNFPILSKDALTQKTTRWAEDISVEPSEPELIVDEKTLTVSSFTPPQNGYSLNIDEMHQILQNELLDLIDKSINNTDQNSEDTNQSQDQIIVAMPIDIIPPKTSLASTNNVGIQDLLGTGVSFYRGSIPNRAFNVNHTAQKLQFIVLKPGEEFSFNKALGPVSAQTGFRSAYVIKNGRTELGDGGGVCQVSTTLFRAALDSGLLITRRLQHSYRVGYYEQGFKPGLDATVYSGNVDLRFVNDTEAHILLYTHNDPQTSTLVTQVYGTDDGRSAKIITHEVWDPRPAPAPQYFPDPSLAPGQVVQVDWAVGGIKTRVVNQITDKNGIIVREDEYVSNYIPWSAKYLIGQ